MQYYLTVDDLKANHTGVKKALKMMLLKHVKTRV